MDQLMIVIDGHAMSVGELDEATRSLRRELLELPVRDVVDVPARAAPAGARVIDAAVIGAVIVLVNSSVALLTSLVTAVRAWRRNTIPDSTIRLRFGDDEIELSGVSDEVQARLLDDWARRHGS
jgi:hypothetical protein